jgi:hypothetical protein
VAVPDPKRSVVLAADRSPWAVARWDTAIGICKLHVNFE